MLLIIIIINYDNDNKIIIINFIQVSSIQVFGSYWIVDLIFGRILKSTF